MLFFKEILLSPKFSNSDFNILWVIAYITLYINVSDFESRFIGALTILLVLAGLVDEIQIQYFLFTNCSQIFPSQRS